MSRFTAIAGLLTFGTLCSLFAKLIYYAEGANRYGKVAKFEKPWFQVLAVRFSPAPVFWGVLWEATTMTSLLLVTGRRGVSFCVGRCRPWHLLAVDAEVGLLVLWSSWGLAVVARGWPLCQPILGVAWRRLGAPAGGHEVTP